MHVKFTARARKWAVAGALALAAIASMEVASAAMDVPTGAMNTGRTEHTASILPNGNVLIAGGLTLMPNGPLIPVATAEIYNPSSGTFSATGSMTMLRNMHVAATLQNGQVLVAGGNTQTAELFNPVTGTWKSTGSMSTARTGAQAVTLKDGRVLVIGNNIIGTAASTCEIYNPATGTFTLSGNLPEQRFGASAVLLSDGRVMLSGGGMPGNPYGNTTPIYADLTTLIWTPATGQWAYGPALATPHMNGTATALPNGKVLVAGGTDQSNNLTANAEIVDPAALWGVATGGMSVARQTAVATLQSDGTVLMAGGQINSPTGPIMTASLESYSPTTGTWQSAGNMTTSRANFTTSTLGNGNLLIAGGATVNPTTNVFSVVQAADLIKPGVAPGTGCVAGGLTIPVSSIAVAANGMTNPFPINASSTCTWAATTNANWITLTNATGTGNGAFSMTIAPDTMFARTGTITINGTTTLQVNEAGQAQVCSPQVNSVGPGVGGFFTYAGGTGTISVYANYGCGWQVTGMPSWVTLTGPTQGNGPGIVTYTVAPNNGLYQTATLQIGQYTYTITQN